MIRHSGLINKKSILAKANINYRYVMIGINPNPTDMDSP